MKVNVKVVTNAKRDKVEQLGKTNYKVRIKAKPVQGRANKHLIKLLEEYFNSKVRLISGKTSKTKIFEIFK